MLKNAAFGRLAFYLGGVFCEIPCLSGLRKC